MATVTIRLTDTNTETGDFDIEITSTPAFPASADDATLAQLYGTWTHGNLIDFLAANGGEVAEAQPVDAA